MTESISYIPGTYAVHPAPLGRFLPPVADGVVREWLASHLPKGAWVIDPFGTSPRLTLEAARAGYRVLVAANNPISRFLIELHAKPPDREMLQAALADLAFDPRSGERLEQQIRSLYETECEQCARMIEAQAFIWERDGGLLAGRIYNCPYCKHSGEYPSTPADAERAFRHAASGLHRSRALERVVPLADPDRIHAEEALEVYPARAVNALLRLVNRVERMVGERRWLANILLLAAFDQGNGLWHYPVIRSRPRALSLPTRYLEKNIWLALEQSVTAWPTALENLEGGYHAVECTFWPDLPSTPEGVCIFGGRLKDLVAQLNVSPREKLQIQGMIEIPPRPNQAFWTLSALWAGWLWGRSSSADFKGVLRRRRYDWGWHLVALHSALSSLTPHLEPGTPCLGLIGEAEPGFLSAVLLSAELAGLDLDSVALRSGQDQAQIHWKRAGGSSRRRIEGISSLEAVEHGILDYLRQRGEPASYLKVHTAAIKAFCETQPRASTISSSPLDSLHQVDEAIEYSLTKGDMFIQFGTARRSLETGQWWLIEKGSSAGLVNMPLADRVEIITLHTLQEHKSCSIEEIDCAVCRELRGLLTPEMELVRECVLSYSLEDETGSGRWHLRPQDYPETRLLDIAQISDLIRNLGTRMGYTIIESAPTPDFTSNPVIIWQAAEGQQSYEFNLSTSGVLGKILFNPHGMGQGYPGLTKQVIVLPGGRAGLVELKLRRDPRMRKEIERGWLLIKFRHIRWLAENEGLNCKNLVQSLSLDPLANRDPQMPLL